MARSLAVLGEALQRLVDEGDILLIDVEAEEPQTPRGAATDAVQELQSLTWPGCGWSWCSDAAGSAEDRIMHNEILRPL